MTENRFAAVDMGTNSFHLIVVEVQEDGSFKLLDREREIIRLGYHKGDELSFISEGETEKAIDILKNFKNVSKLYNAEMRAVATSAVREAKNQLEFVKKVFEQTGINIEVIEGKKEAELIFKGAVKIIKPGTKKVLCADIGGGSTEIIFGKQDKIDFAESVKLGAVRLAKKYFPDFILTDNSVADCENYIKEKIEEIKHKAGGLEFDLAVGASGTIQSAAALTLGLAKQKIPKNLGGLLLKKDDLLLLYEEIKIRKKVEERMQMTGMELKRADIIPAGIFILKNIFDIFKIDEMRISEYALREGIIIDTISKQN
jgi:exopolyphosphatase/guanosine-5'-triphosphate,3'-diphosphate pyrophosphatase